MQCPGGRDDEPERDVFRVAQRTSAGHAQSECARRRARSPRILRTTGRRTTGRRTTGRRTTGRSGTSSRRTTSAEVLCPRRTTARRTTVPRTSGRRTSAAVARPAVPVQVVPIHCPPTRRSMDVEACHHAAFQGLPWMSNSPEKHVAIGVQRDIRIRGAASSSPCPRLHESRTTRHVRRGSSARRRSHWTWPSVSGQRENAPFRLIMPATRQQPRSRHLSYGSRQRLSGAYLTHGRGSGVAKRLQQVSSLAPETICTCSGWKVRRGAARNSIARPDVT